MNILVSTVVVGSPFFKDHSCCIYDIIASHMLLGCSHVATIGPLQLEQDVIHSVSLFGVYCLECILGLITALKTV